MRDRKLNIRKFDPNIAFAKGCFLLVIIARRRGGKSVYIMDVIYHLHLLKYPRVVVFSGTEEGNEFFSNRIPKSVIYHGMCLQRLEKIMEDQRQIVANVRKAEADLGRPLGVDTRLLIVLDDVMYKKNISRSEVFAQIFCNGRHWNITMLVTCQYVMMLDTTCRANIDYVVCLKETMPGNRKRIYENWFGMFPRSQDFYNVLDQCTQNYEALICDNTQPTTDPNKCVFWYRAPFPAPVFEFGSAEFRERAAQQDADSTAR